MIADLDHGPIRLLAAGAALDDLDATERADYDRHLSGCSSCQVLAADLGDVVADLALVAPTLVPPTTLRGDVLAALRGPATPLRDLPSPVPAAAAVPAAPRQPRAALWGSLGLAAVMGIVAVGRGAQTVRLSDQVAAANAAAAEAQVKVAAREAAIALVADPSHRTASLHAEPVAPVASAVVVYRPGSTDAYLMAMDLPATPAGQVYQLWVADDTGVHALGTFHFDGQGAFVAPFGVDLGASAAAMVTLEPEGGAQGEPGPQVVFGEI
ncbi:MAG: anti-sigma factor domain-containing protein [Candidatus Limnocylindrales bacterium]